MIGRIKYRMGQVALPALLSAVALITPVFVWTYSQFGTVNVQASETNQRVSRVEQKSDDIDARLTRIENKLDQVLKQ